MPGRTGQQCAQRWRHKVNPNIRKDKWTDAEDATVSSLPARHLRSRPVAPLYKCRKIARARAGPDSGRFHRCASIVAHPLPSLARPQLQELVKTHGLRWADIARSMPGRTDQQCMGRWRRHLDPAVPRAWTTREDRRLTELRVKHGANWSAIAKTMKNRTAQQCRARWFQAHFTGHRYLDADGNLLSPRAADKAEKEIDFAKAAAEAGKTLRPNGVKASATNHNVDNIINSRGIVKDEKSDGHGKKRKVSRDLRVGRGGSSSMLDRTRSRGTPAGVSRRARMTDGPRSRAHLRARRPAPRPRPRRFASAAVRPSPIRSVSLNRQVSLPPDIADLIAREAAIDDATAAAAATSPADRRPQRRRRHPRGVAVKTGRLGDAHRGLLARVGREMATFTPRDGARRRSPRSTAATGALLSAPAGEIGDFGGRASSPGEASRPSGARWRGSQARPISVHATGHRRHRRTRGDESRRRARFGGSSDARCTNTNTHALEEGILVSSPIPFETFFRGA